MGSVNVCCNFCRLFPINHRGFNGQHIATSWMSALICGIMIDCFNVLRFIIVPDHFNSVLQFFIEVIFRMLCIISGNQRETSIICMPVSNMSIGIKYTVILDSGTANTGICLLFTVGEQITNVGAFTIHKVSASYSGADERCRIMIGRIWCIGISGKSCNFHIASTESTQNSADCKIIAGSNLSLLHFTIVKIRI